MNYSELVGYMVKSLVDHPDQVEIREIEGEKSTILELKVIKEDIGKVIGKHGRIARAIRTDNKCLCHKIREESCTGNS